ncbi:MAG TPA: glycoside hydrolase [Chthoniobacterales bacterium]
MIRILLPALLAFILPLTQCLAEAKAVVRLDPARTQGIWEGWGVSLCWWAKVFGDRKDLADLLFTTKEVTVAGQKLPGLGLNIVRYNAGACSGNTVDGRRMVISKTILPFRQIQGFWLDGKSGNPASRSWDWSVDANQRAMLQKARDRGANRFELFSNSPMWWMCANDNPSGAAAGTKDNLPPQHYDAFATYLATIARYARDHWGITFTGIEPFNEPSSGYWFENGKQEGCGFSQTSQAAFLPHLRAALDRQGLNSMPIVASDETSFSEALQTWRSFPNGVKALASRVNVHGYEGAKGPRAELHAAVATDGKPLWNSEHGDKIADGLDMARELMLDFQQLRPSAWCYWQALDEGNDGGWGLIVANLAKKAIGRANPKFFVLAQFTRHIRPGMTILDTGNEDVVAAYDPVNRMLVVVLRGGDRESTKQIDIRKFHVPDEMGECWITEPKSIARYEKRPGPRIQGGRVCVELPAHSIQTVEIANAAW